MLHFKYFKLIPAIFLILIFSGCEKGVLKLGNDILPNGDMVSLASTDTLNPFSYTMFDPKFQTNAPAISFLGQSFDPYFGTTNTEFVTQIRLGQQWGDSLMVVDSVKLDLRFLSAHGITASDELHTMRISEIGDVLSTDSAYYSTSKPSLEPGGYVLTVPVKGIVNDTLNEFEATLPKEFGEYLIRDTSMLFYSNIRPDFRTYFKGLYFQMDPSDAPLILSLSIAPPSVLGEFYNAIVLYMHTSITGYKHAFSFVLDATNRNAGYNLISHDFSTATQGNKMIHVNTTYKDTLSYLQGLNGVYTKISLPGLTDLKNDSAFHNIGVNKARLTVPVRFVADADHKYISKSLPASLQLRYSVKDEGKFDVPDYNIGTNHAFFDGKLDSVNKVYVFNFPAFVQAYLENKDGYVNPEVEIYQTLGLKNVVFEANKSKTPVKFEFTYTKF